ncbi:PKD domain-containing protein [Natrononativus amylolyticus]|uniref:PKD domain-containing protein n=1 Tax=Natrononativus amylolyticus TaxID=2963434 RepID=UPI0020CFCA04|nr:PKD domain-containing protein [Natrononativus amylolyticus]
MTPALATSSSAESLETTEDDVTNVNVEIEHDYGTTTHSQTLHASVPAIRTSAYDETFEIGGESSLEFRIENTATGDLVTVSPTDDAEAVSANLVEFFLYGPSGALDPEEYRSIGVDGPDGWAELPVTVEGDTELFEGEETFAPYEISLVDADSNEVIDSTGERVMGVGYDAPLEYDSADNELEITIPRDDGVDPGWDVTFELENAEHEPVYVTRLENEANADAFEFTIDGTDLEAGEYSWNLRFDTADQEFPVHWISEYKGLVVTGPSFEFEPHHPDTGELVTFDVTDGGSSEVDNDEYKWDFGDGETAIGETVTHSFEEIGAYEVELTVLDSETDTNTATETVAVGGYTLIQHSESRAGGRGTGDYRSQRLIIETSNSDETFELGGDAATALRVVDTEADKSVTVTPVAESDRFTVDGAAIDIYGGTGEIRDEPQIQAYSVTDGTGWLDVDLEGDTEMFTEGALSSYVVELVDTDEDVVIGATDERVTGIGYEGWVDQHGTEDEITLTIPRDDDVDESWDVVLQLRDPDDRTVYKERLLENDAGADTLSVTIDGTALADGAYDARVTFYEEKGERPYILLFTDRRPIIVGDVDPVAAIDAPSDPVVNEHVSFSAWESEPERFIEQYHWDFGDGESVTTEDHWVSHSFTEPGEHEVELTVETADGEQDTTTTTVTVADVETISVSGALELSDGEPATGDTVLVFLDGGGVEMTLVDETGEYDFELPEREDAYELQYYRGDLTVEEWDAFMRDGFVDVYGLDTVPGDENTYLGPTQLPAGHVVEVTVVDEADNPVSDAIVYHTHVNDETDTTAGLSGLTNDDGVVDPGGEPGLELSGTVELEVEPPEDDRFVDRTYERTLEVTDDESVEIVLEEVDGDDVLIEPYFETESETGVAEELITFDASGAVALEGDEEIDFDAYHWDFGDGTETTTTDPVIEHAFADAGDYDVTATFSAGGTEETYDRTITVAEPVEPAFFDVTDLDPKDITLEQGEVTDITATVTNTGDEPATQDVEFRVNDEVLSTEPVTLDATEEDTVTFADIDTASLEPGEHTYAVGTDDDAQTGSLTVEELPEPAFFVVDIDDIDDTIGQGDQLTVVATVANDGDEPATQTVTLEIGEGTATLEEEVELAGGDSEEVVFTYDVPADATPVETPLTVTTADHSDTATVDVFSTEEYAVTITETSAPVTAGDTLDVTVTVENVGSGVAEQTLDLEVGEETQTATIDLEPGASEPYTFAYDTDEGDVPGVTIAAATEDDDDTTTARIQSAEPATFEITEFNVPATATQGDTIDVEATVANVGDLGGAETIILSLDGVEVATETVDLDGGETTLVSLEYELPHEPRAGEHDRSHSVATTTDVAVDTLTVDYGTIESGLAAADAGDTVAVAAGEYDESVTVETPDVRIQGVDGADATTIRPVDDTAFEIDATGVILSGMTIEGDDTGTGIVTTADETTVLRTTVTDVETGLLLDGSDGHTVAHNTITDTETAIELRESDGNAITNNIIDTTAVDAAQFSLQSTAAGGDGIVFTGGADETIVTENDVRVTGDAIRIDEDAGTANAAARNNLEADHLSVNNELNPTTFDGEANYYGEGGLEANTAGEVTDENEVDEPYETADYHLTIEDVTESVAVGDELDVTVDVTNTGDYTGLQDIELALDGTVIANEHDLSVAHDESTQITFTYEPTAEDVAVDAPLIVSSDDGDVTTDVTIQQAPLFVVSDVTAPEAAEQGESITVQAQVENEGAAADQDLELRLGDDLSDADAYTVLESTSLTLEGDQTTVGFTTTLPADVDEGVTMLGVASADSIDEVTVSVLEADDTDEKEEGDDDSGDTTPPPADDDDTPDETSPAHVDVTAIDAPTDVEVGEQVTVTVSLTNSGDDVETADVTLVMNDEAVDDQHVTLESGESDGVTFSLTAPDTPGDVDLVVTTPDDTATTTLVVTPLEESTDDCPTDDDADDCPADDATDADDETETDDGTPAETDDEADDVTGDDSDTVTEADDDEPSDDESGSDAVPGFAVLPALIALFVSMLVLRRRR